MPSYDYKCSECGSLNNVVHSIKEDALKETFCSKCELVKPCNRVISKNSCPPIFNGNGWTVKSSGFGKRGYKGKFQDHVRPIGTPVDAPADKAEADKQFQRYVDSGGLDGIKPTFNMTDKNDPRRPKTAKEVVGG